MSDNQPHHKGRSRFLLVCGSLLVLVVAVLALSQWLDTPVTDEGATTPATKTPVPLVLDTNGLELTSKGVVNASRTTLLAPGVSGKVNKVHPEFNAGEVLRKGTSLIELEDFEYRARLANAEAELEKARLDVATEQAEALKAVKKTYSSASKQGKDSDLVLRVPQRRAVNARQRAAEAYVEEAKQALLDTVLTAPYDCQVVESSVGVGTRLSAGQTIGKIIPLTERIVRVPLPLEDFSSLPRNEKGKIEAALTAYCTLKNGSSMSWDGHITAVDSTLDASGACAVLIASLDPNADHVPEWRVAPVNMPLQVRIKVQVPNSVWIPVALLEKGRILPVTTANGVKFRMVNISS